MTVYLSGGITGREDYKSEFKEAKRRIADGEICSVGIIPTSIVLNPAELPRGLSDWQYMRICFSMIDCADVVIALLSGRESRNARLEHDYAKYIGKRIIYM